MNINEIIGGVKLEDLNYKTKYMLVLYKYPLYQNVDEKGKIRIAVCANVDQEVEDGGENFKKACEFVDTCLQIAPMDNHSLEFHFITDNPEVAWEKISESRPALGYFLQVKVEGERKDELNDDDSKHGYKDKIIIRKEEDEKKIREDWMNKPDSRNKKYYAYAFMEKNLEIDGCSKTTITLGNENKWLEQGKETDVKDLYAEIVRMAFNVYMSYSNSINDRNNKWKNFYDSEYNRLSSMANAVSIKYKLKSIGVNWDEENRQKVADCFRKEIEARDGNSEARDGNSEARDGNSVIEKLAALEHRRWIFERVAEGYTAPLKVKEGTDEYELDYDKIINQIAKTGKALCKGEKEEEEKWHACLLKSWASETPDEKDELDNMSETPGEKDELDNMSETLADELDKKAKRIRQLKIFDGAPQHGVIDIGDRAKMEFNKYQNELQDNQTWREYKYCVNSIMDGNNYYYEKYKSYEEKLKETELLKDDGWMKDMTNVIELVNAANCRRNYKQTDRDLVKMIPFILTYRTDLHLIMPFENVGGFSDRTERMFKNVASATLLNPEKITYLFNMDNRTNLGVLTDNINRTVKYLEKSELLDDNNGSHVTFALINNLKAEEIGEKLKQRIKEFRNNRVKVVTEINEIKEILNTTEEFLCFDVTCSLYKSVKDNAEFITGLKNKEKTKNPLIKSLKDVKSVFEVSIEDREIVIVDGDNGISNNDIKPHIMIQGLTALWGLDQSFDRTIDYIAEYDILWSAYYEFRDVWGDVTTDLEKQENIQTNRENLNNLEKALCEKGIIDDKGKFTSEVYRRLFEKAGNMLEVYIYHKMIASGHFDDFALSLVLKGGDDNHNISVNEFDGVFVKGFSTHIVECKSGKITEDTNVKETLYKLGALGSYYGINNRSILVAMDEVQNQDLRKRQLNIESYTPEKLIKNFSEKEIVHHIRT